MDGVTVIVASIGVGPLLTGLNEILSPIPFSAKPICVLLFVQLKIVPD